ncbi:MAG: allantoinase AllB [Bacteroidetes bacterium]|nr:MAG: allantoinase AllB [Bacteroidota bacterium]REK04733.1 MAG: allantoinase AllB [Bacteroidota bacterium]REK36207.1 MAG: allantoinase AllB [Bacteroidota bacterium]REK51422.1 MAG: allantoinase AllB [Bacteroidota bacterium]
MTADLAIYCKKTLLPEGLSDVSVLISEGKISGIVEGKAGKEMAKKIESAGESVLMPGLIDCHVHINEPGRTDWEGFETATKAAAAGGVTTLIDMPLNSSPVTTSTKNLKAKLEASAGKLFVNCGFWGGIVPDNEKELEPLAKDGVFGFKVFLTHSGIDEFPNTTLKHLEKIASLLSKLDIPLLVHAELDVPGPGIQELRKNPHSYLAYLHSRPASWEDKAIEAIIQLCEKHKVRSHIVHLSSSNALQMISEAKAKGLPLSVETCPHYLYFNAEEIPDADTRFKCAPPIREKENNEKLWNALAEGLIDFVVTDHSPAPPEMKELFTGNLLDAWGGIASIQFSLPIMWSLAEKNNKYVKDINQWMSRGVAEFLGLHQKGEIKVGNDADLVIWNPHKKMKVTKPLIKYKHPVSPYEGLLLSGLVEKTYVGGALVYDKGSFVSSPPGKILLRNND